MSLVFNDVDYDKILNSICGCGSGLPWIKEEILMMYPCEHMYHKGCYFKIHDNVCKICGEIITNTISMFDKNIHHQRFADILSVSYYEDMSSNTPGNFVDSIFDIASLFAKMPFINDVDSGNEFCEQIFSLNNLTMKVYGIEKLKLEKNKVFISNHVSYLEFAVLYYILGSGYLASNMANDSKIVDQVKKFVKLLIVTRGDKNRKKNIVDEMRKFVDENGSICLFPEGMMKHPDTLVRFRSGAFHVNRPIYTVTIRHNDVVASGYVNRFLYKLGAKRNINMEVHILGPYYPPFDDLAIKRIRNDMAFHGNMVLSRVSNRDIKDKKSKH